MVVSVDTQKITTHSLGWMLLGLLLTACHLFHYSKQLLTVNIALAALVLSLTHFVLYPFIWFYPDVWLGLWGDKRDERVKYVAVRRFSQAVSLHKALILGVFFFNGWYPGSSGGSAADAVLASASRPSGMIAALVFLAALYVQFWVYKQIGEKGVYYGFKFGLHIPWCRGFPFDTFRHPQYVSAMSLLTSGCVFVGWRPEFGFLVSFTLLGYGVTCIMEEAGENDSEAKAK